MSSSSTHETLIRSLRKDLETSPDHGDEGTTDFLTGLMQAHEKTAWMLRAYVRQADCQPLMTVMRMIQKEETS
jgi:DNA-binding ferritin-like protein